MIEIPTFRPELIGSLESDFGTTIASSIWLKIINNHAWVERNIPIGFLLPFHRDLQPVSGPALPDPTSDIWQFCDGTVISDSDSPIDGQAVPDLRSSFLKGTSGTQFVTGGQETISLFHDHITGFTDNRQPDTQADNNNDLQSGIVHNHPVTNDLSLLEDIVPLHIEYHIYMRYK